MNAGRLARETTLKSNVLLLPSRLFAGQKRCLHLEGSIVTGSSVWKHGRVLCRPTQCKIPRRTISKTFKGWPSKEPKQGTDGILISSYKYRSGCRPFDDIISWLLVKIWKRTHFIFRETLRLWWPLKLSKWHGEWKLEGKTGLLSEGGREITGTQSGRSRRQDWKPEPKGVITYTPKSDMTIHLGVEDGGIEAGWMEGGRGPCHLFFPSVSPCSRSTSHINTHNGRRWRLGFPSSDSCSFIHRWIKGREESLGKSFTLFFSRHHFKMCWENWNKKPFLAAGSWRYVIITSSQDRKIWTRYWTVYIRRGQNQAEFFKNHFRF